MAGIEKEITGGFFTGSRELAELLINIGASKQQAEENLRRDIIYVDGTPFVWDSRNQKYVQLEIALPKDDPAPSTLQVFTLDGLIAYIQEDTEEVIPPPDSGDRLILQVLDERRVVLLGKPSKNQKKRNVIAACEAHTPKIEFGFYMDTDAFCTMLLSTFLDTEARDLLFKTAKSMTSEQTMATADDGVSQVITVKQGVSMATNVNFKNPVPLRPMRTFTEVEQPESNFTLRVNEKAAAALFEADGGAWKNEAVASIAAYLRDRLDGYNVVVIA